MEGKRIFYIASNELTAVYCAGGKVQLLGEFPATPEGITQFGEYLGQEPDLPSAFMLDVIEEEFRLDTIPHVLGADQKKLLERKLAGQFRSTPYRSATIAGREKTGRKDDRVMFSGLTNPEALDPWLAELRQHKVPLMGIYSVPMLTSQLIKRLKIKHANTLVLTIQKDQLLRQSFFSNGELKISRLTPLASTEINACMDSILHEVERNERYLGRLQLLNFREPMQVYFLSEGESLYQFKSRCVGTAKVYYHALDANEVAKKAGLKDVQLVGRNEFLFSHLLSLKLPASNYAPKKECSYFSFYTLRRQAVAASVVLALGAAGWSVSQVFDGQQLKQEAETIALNTQRIQQEYDEHAARMPELPYQPRVMRAAVESDRALEQHKPVPLEALVLIGRGLAKHSNVALDEVSWSSASATTDDGAMQEEFVDPENMDEMAQEPITNGGSATLRAHLKQFPKDYKRAFDEVEALIETLKSSDRIQSVKAVNLPLETDPKRSLVGQSQRDVPPPAAAFELELILKGGDQDV